MANYKSAIKDIRRNKVRRERNRASRSKLRTLLKKVNTVLDSNQSKDEVLVAYKEFASYMDRTARKGLFHKNFAARNKSRFMKKINSLNN